MPFTGDKYIGDLALYYAAKKLDSGTNKKVLDLISPSELYAQRKSTNKNITRFASDEIQAAANMADRMIANANKSIAQFKTKPTAPTEADLFSEAEKVANIVTDTEKQVGQLNVPDAASGAFESSQFASALDEVMKKSVQNTLSESGGLERDTFLRALGYEDVAEGPGIPFPTTSDDSTPAPSGNPGLTGDSPPSDDGGNDDSGDDDNGDGGDDSGFQRPPRGSGQITNTAFASFNNIPINALYWKVGDDSYIVYEVPGSNGELYEGSPIFLAYELQGNDLYQAGLITQGMDEPQFNAIMDQAFFDSIAVVTGNTDQLTADIDNPFASFVETISEQAQVAPWITDPEMLELIAEAAVEGRTVSDAEWQTTTWYQTHSESEREWLRTFYADPSTAAQTITDGQIAVGNALQAAGVSNAPEALVNWIADKFVTGQWTQNYTTEQISLFADPYAEGKRDTDFESYLTSTAITGVDRTSQREAEVKQLYSQYLGPVLGKITDGEAAEIAGKLRNDPDYRDQLVAGLKQSRLAAFSAYTNPELTYEDIARPWRNLTASVWGQAADETQGWWQDMIKTNDFAQAEETLRTKGLELDITQVTQDATTALTQALGQGNISQSGVNV
jgi:hypothetical protein